MTWFLAFVFVIGCGLSAAAPTDDDLPSYGIVGGERADIRTLPYQISLANSGRHSCGGSILSANVVITAAHCTDGQSASRFTVRAGSNYHKEGGQVVRVSRIIQHPSFSFNTVDNDIALLILASPLKFESGVRPISLPSSDIPTGKMAVVSGWGAVGEGRPASPYLQKVGATVFPRSQCQSIYRSKMTPNMFCAGYMSAGKDSCQGDSGGPLAYGNTLIGIVSWGYGCAREGLPGLYTYLVKYVPWIKSHVRV